MVNIANEKMVEILLVEPDILYREFIAVLLEAKANCDFASNVSEGLQKTLKKSYDMVITEMIFGDKTALEMIRQIKKESPHTVIVIITGKENYAIATGAIRLGAIDILKKPFSIENMALVFEKFFSIQEETERDFFLHSAVIEKTCSYILPTSINRLYQFIGEFMLILKRFPTMNRPNLIALRLVVYEMLLNAIEHGNLEIDFSKKQELLKRSSSEYFLYLQNLCHTPPFNERKIFLDYHYQHSWIEITIEDEGKGFDTLFFLTQAGTESLDQLNGRGILLSRFNLDEIRYNAKGNRVTLKKNL